MDMLIGEDFDLAIKNGDFEVGDDTQQRVLLLMRAEQGHFKQSPLAGVGFTSMIGGSLTQELERNIRLQLESDNITVSKIIQNGDDFQIDVR